MKNIPWSVYITPNKGIVLEISSEIAKKIKRKEIRGGYLQQWVQKKEFDNDNNAINNTLERARERPIKIIDKSIDAWKLSTLLVQV